MRKIWLMAAVAALAACQPSAPDPIAEAQRTCESATGQEQITACTTVIDAEVVEAEARTEALTLRAAARREAGEVTAALRDYESALQADENNVAALLGRADILLTSGQLDAASAMVERASATDRSGQAHLIMGRIAFHRGDYINAVTQLDSAIAQNGDLAQAYATRARVKKANNDREGARADFSDAIRRDGALAEARAGRCRLNLEDDENLDQARDDAEASALADPRNVEGQICRGILQLREKQNAEALASFAAALQVEPGNPEALFGHGIARMRTGDSQGSRDMNRARDFSEHIGQRYVELGVNTW